MMSDRDSPVKRKVSPRKFPTDDSSMADAYLRSHGKRIAYVEEIKRWRYFDGRCWVDDPNGSRVRNSIEAFVRNLPQSRELHAKVKKQYLGAFKIRRVEERARDKHSVSIKFFDSDPALVNLANGILDVDSGEFWEHDPSFGLTNLIDVEYDSEVSNGEWYRWLKTTLGKEEYVSALQTVMGYSVFSDGNPERLLVLLKGPTSTGKSTFIETLETVLGKWAKACSLTIFRGKYSDASREDIAAVIKCRIIHSSEASDVQELHSDQIKRLTGSDTIPFRKHHAEMQEFKPSFVPFIATNDIPTIKGADEPLERRFMAVPFSRQIKRRNERKRLSETLATKCGSEILAWLLEGYWNYCENGLSDAWETFRVESRKAFNETNIYSQFMADCTVRKEGHFLTNEEIRNKFMEYMVTQGHTSTTEMREIGKRLTGLGWKESRNKITRGRIGRAFR